MDSSVWFAQLRGETNPAVARLHALVHGNDDQILIGDPILLEVLQGARSDAHAARIERNLRRFPIASMLDETTAVRAARNYRLLRAQGITIRETIDMIVGAFCLIGGHALLHDDRDFAPLATHLGLSVG
ncbi:MAG TPA: PIN domain nuclease [Acetobacteraceae bacterium]